MHATAAGAGELVAVDLLQESELDGWERFVAAHPDATIYHSLEWRAVTENGFGHRPYYLRALEGGAIAGVLPLFLVTGLFGRRLVSVPMRDRGGVLALKEHVAAALVKHALRLSAEFDCRYLELRSVHELPEPAAAAHGLRLERHWITTRVDLSAGTDALWRNLDKNAVRWAIGKARREGVRVDQDDSLEGVDLFYTLFARTRRGLGIPCFPRRLFHAIWTHLIRDGRAVLFIARKGDVPINAMISFRSGDSFIPAYAAPQREWVKSYPSETMLWHAIEWAVARGFRYFDFGADSPQQTGLLWFKKKWGGMPHAMHYYYGLRTISNPPSFDSSSPAYALARRVWRRLPLGIGTRLGSWVTCQLS